MVKNVIEDRSMGKGTVVYVLNRRYSSSPANNIGFWISLSSAMLTQYPVRNDRDSKNRYQDFLERKFHLSGELRQYAIYSMAYRYK